VLTAGAFLAWYSAIGRLGVDRAGLFVGVMPVSALLAGVALGTGTVSMLGLLGTLVVGAGVVLGISRTSPAPASTTISARSIREQSASQSP
jgi:drug/metabolite transporter (DMT)-like permease